MHRPCEPCQCRPGSWQGLSGPIYLGDERFVAQMQALADGRRVASHEVPKTQRGTPREAEACFRTKAKR
ncbi:MAG: hypothetical protein WCH44_02475 [Betaproteobacteria bacterium]